ncbi:MAG: SIMPL domain-containing protein [Bacteroidales bacterium]|nr:SIMPL domain-containing protein [Bacteroidales bacterium]
MNSKFGMIGLIFIGICMVIAVNRFKSYDRSVSVKGLCEKEVMADKVIWPLVYKVVGNDMEAIYREIKAKNAIVVEYLESEGIPASEISVSAPNVVDLKAERYASEERAYRYNVTCVITVASRQVEKILGLTSRQGELISRGVTLVGGDYQYNTIYEFTGLNEIKPQMIEEATANARQVAQKFAEDSKSRLGKIKRASQGQFSVTNRDSNTPYIKNVRVVTSIDYYLR